MTSQEILQELKENEYRYYGKVELKITSKAYDKIKDLLNKSIEQNCFSFSDHCDGCGRTVFPHMKYCSACGKALSWEINK